MDRDHDAVEELYRRLRQEPLPVTPLVADLANPTPALGFAAGIERIILNLKKQKVAVPALPGPKVFIAYLGDEAKEGALKLAATLRGAGIGAIEALGAKSLKAQLRQANNLSLPYAVIIGEEEVKAGTVILRDMVSSEQKSVPVGKLQGLLKG